jgi:hypothetical protein
MTMITISCTVLFTILYTIIWTILITIHEWILSYCYIVI